MQAPDSPVLSTMALSEQSLSSNSLHSSSTTSSVRMVLESARRTRDAIRASRASVRVLRQDSRNTLRRAQALQHKMEGVLRDYEDDRCQQEDHNEHSDEECMSHVSDITM